MSNGTVKWYHGGWKRGVITPDDGTDDILFHQRDVVCGVRLVKGDLVQFTEVDGKATCVHRT